MKILLVTGKLAENTIKKYVKDSKIDVSVLTLPFAVASLMTQDYILGHLKKNSLEKYDLILVPGLIRGDVSLIRESIGIRTFKGPKHAADLPIVLSRINDVELSSKVPADEIIRDDLAKWASKTIKELENEEDVLLHKQGNLRIGKIAAGMDFPVKILAEITDIPKLRDDEIRSKAIYYENSGADIIDLGMIAGVSNPDEVRRALSIIRKVVQIPISIDSMDPAEIEVAVKNGIELILSLDGGNISEISKFATNIPSVVIPTDFSRKIFPKKAIEKCTLLENNMKKAIDHGFKTLIADPILDPLINPGIAESIVAAYRYRNLHPDTLMLLGAGNVTELVDVDSIGVNAIIAGIATELQVNFLLTTEVSDKVAGSVYELSKSSDMMFIAKKRDSIPKEIGIDLLFLKESKKKEESFTKKMKDFDILVAEEADNYLLDPKGYFKIILDRVRKDIILLHYSKKDLEKANLVIKGKSSRDIYKKIISIDLISNLEHAAYIGSELERAEIALKIGRSYLQDSKLF